MEIRKLNASAVNGDGSRINLTWATEGEPLTVELSTDTLQTMVQELTGVLVVARQKADPDAPIPAPTPRRFRAGLAEDGTVLVSFETKNGLMHHFALPPNDATRLRSRIDEALRQGKRSRHN